MTRLEAIQEFQTLNPSVKAFKALGLPFEAFLRFAQLPKSVKETAVVALMGDIEAGRI